MATDELMNQSRTYAESVVTLVWLVLLAAALKGKSQVTALDIPEYALVIAFPTIIIGICPLLLCCCSNNKRAFSDVAGILSAAMLLSIACSIAALTVGLPFVLVVNGLSLCFTVLRAMCYTGQKNDPEHEVRTKEFHTILDGSHEFLCCMTGIHFVWLGSLALESQISKSHALSVPISIGNISICAIGLCAMILEMTPPLKYSTIGDIAVLLSWFDSIMVATIGIVFEAAMFKSLVLPQYWWMLVIAIPLVIIGPSIALVAFFLHVSCPEEAGGSQDNETPKLAPLGLTKLMVTGFLTVSIIVESTEQSIAIYWFLVFAAAAIISGLTWRLLTQAQVIKMLENNIAIPVTQEREDKIAAVASSAKFACFFAHAFVAIATFILMIEIYIVKSSTNVAAPAPAPTCT